MKKVSIDESQIQQQQQQSSSVIGETTKLDCRFYENKYPKVGDYVVAKINQVLDDGAYVVLLEYNNIEGMIAPNEITKFTNIKGVHKILREGKIEVLKVITVDEKGYIDLSKKQVQPDDIQAAEKQFQDAKQVYGIARQVAFKLQINIDHIYEKVIWPLSKVYSSTLEAFKIALYDANKIFDEVDIEENIKQALLQEIKRRLTPTAVKIRADFEMSCFSYDGIDAIKYALRQGLTVSQPEKCEIKFQVIAPPHYVVITTCYDKNYGISKLEESLKLVEQSLKQQQGHFVLKTPPKVLGDKGEKDIKDLIEKLEQTKNYEGSEEEDNDEGMDADIGVDTDEIDRQQELEEQKQK